MILNYNSALTRLGGEWQGQIGVCEERFLLVVFKQLSKGPDAKPDMEREERRLFSAECIDFYDSRVQLIL